MTTTETVFVIILVIELTLFFAFATIAAYFGVKIAQNVRTISDKAVLVVDNVETAAETLKNASGKLAVIKMVQNIVEMAQRKK